MTWVYEVPPYTWLQRYSERNPIHPRLVDLWSVGVILYEAVFGSAPFSSQSLDELILKIKEETPIVIPRDRKLSKECRKFLSSCLQRDPDQRINFEELKEHPFLDLEDSIPTENTITRMLEYESMGDLSADKSGNKEAVIENYQLALKLATTLYYYGQDDEERRKFKVYLVKYRNKLNEQTERYNSVTSKVLGDSSQQQYLELRQLSRGTPGLSDGLEILATARNYLLEGDIQQAVDKYTAGISVLMPLLQNEPKGRRRELLHGVITSALDQAETLKNSVEAESETMQKSGSSSSGEKDKASCILQ